MIKNILIVGVGGQGTLLTSKILGQYAALKNYDCKLSEVHGMAQRGGSVVTHVRFGDKVYSPIISEGGADVILAFEKLESYRYRHFLAAGGLMLVNDMEIHPMPVITGAEKYPADIKEILTLDAGAVFIDAAKLAKDAGSIKAVNTVMVGALAKIMDFDYTILERAAEMCVPAKSVELNKRALYLGYSECSR